MRGWLNNQPLFLYSFVMTYTYNYPRPAVTVDIIIMRCHENTDEVLLIERLNPPFQNSWALPGGFVDKDENLSEAASRELKEETGLHNIELVQFYTFGDKGRDPRGHTVSVVYYGVLASHQMQAVAGDDAKKLRWFNINDLPPLAFDHNDIMQLFKEKVLEAG